MDAPCRETFSASHVQYAFGGSPLNIWKGSGYRIRKTRRDCLKTSSPYYSLCLMRSGDLISQQSGREALIRPGDCGLRYADEPGFFQATPGDALTLRIPEKTIERWLPSPRDVTAISLTKHSRWGGALAATLAALDPACLDQLAVTPQAITESICSLLALAVDPTDPAVAGHQASTLRRFRQMLRDRFHEPDFSPAILAEEQGVSRRTLHYVFAHAGSSFGAELKTLRMERARQLLEAPGFKKKPIADIARHVGFVHASHFVTTFRRFYGITPSGYQSIRRS